MSSPTASKPLITREVNQILLSKEQSEGVGARVRRSIGRPELRNFDPFLMLDEAQISAQGGFPDHPHRGTDEHTIGSTQSRCSSPAMTRRQETCADTALSVVASCVVSTIGIQTVSYMLPDSTGSFEHEDFLGSKGVLKPGTVQWMNAGRGIVHSEMPKNAPGEVAHGLQLWITLPKKEKMSKPWYQELAPERFPTAKKDGVEARIISGSAFGTESPINISLVPVHYVS
jgi:redox-sensitive bicupin YhaK (pirin superfamily)